MLVHLGAIGTEAEDEALLSLRQGIINELERLKAVPVPAHVAEEKWDAYITYGAVDKASTRMESPVVDVLLVRTHADTTRAVVAINGILLVPVLLVADLDMHGVEGY